jgi:hypothetical protein
VSHVPFNPLTDGGNLILSTRELCAMIDDINTERHLPVSTQQPERRRDDHEDRDRWNETQQRRDW